MGKVFKPVFDRVVIKRDVIEKTAGGLMVAADMQQVKNGMAHQGIEFNSGIVVSVGETVDHPLIVPGALVHFGKHAGAYIHPGLGQKKKQLAAGETPTGEEEKYFVCAEADIIGVMVEETSNG